MDKESATLVLRSVNCNITDVTNNTWTWRNVNLRKAMGTIYDKHETFKLCFTSFGSSSTTITNAVDRTVNVYMNMSNCTWINSGYNVSTNNRTQNCLLSTIDLNNNSGRSINFTGEVGILFKKPSSAYTDITITFTRCSDDSINSAQAYANSVYCFSIYGVKVDGKS